MAVVFDTIDGSLNITENGPVQVRHAKIDGVSTSNSDFSYFAALAQLTSAGITYGAAHPENTAIQSAGLAPIFVTDINISPADAQNTIFDATITYSAPTFEQQEPGETESDASIQVGSSVSSGKTQRDKDGNKIVVQLTDNDDKTGDADIQLPETVIQFERRESSSPLSKSLANVGFVNSASIGVLAARTLLCLGIDGTTNDNGNTWNVVYRFQYKPDTWDAQIVYIDPETGQPHKDIDFGTADEGWTVERIYPEVNFSALNLPF